MDRSDLITDEERYEYAYIVRSQLPADVEHSKEYAAGVYGNDEE